MRGWETSTFLAPLFSASEAEMNRKKRIEGPFCRIEGCNNLRKSKGRTKNGYQMWGGLCSKHRGHPASGSQRYKRVNNFVPCEICGFIPVDRCQMDRDHINGNHKDNEPDNIQILCANCHRLKTKINQQGIFAGK